MAGALGGTCSHRAARGLGLPLRRLLDSGPSPQQRVVFFGQFQPTAHISSIKGCWSHLNSSFLLSSSRQPNQSLNTISLKPQIQTHLQLLHHYHQLTLTSQPKMHSSIILAGLFTAMTLAQSSSSIPAVSQISDGQVQATGPAAYVCLLPFNSPDAS